MLISYDKKASGLEQDLRVAILIKLEKSAFAKKGKDLVYKNIFEANLLDDESLPVLDMIF